MDHGNTHTNRHADERATTLSVKEKITSSKGFSLLPKLGRHFSETFDAMDLKWGLLLAPWYRRSHKRYLSLTLYLEDGPRDLEESGDLKVSYRITLFNQGCGDDKKYRDTVTGVVARRLACKWESIGLVSLDVFLDPSYGFLVDDTCLFGVEILDVTPTCRRSLPASDTGRFRWTIRGFSAEQKRKAFICKRFSACGYNWDVFVLTGRHHSLGSESLHIHVCLSSSHTFCQLFGRLRIRLVNQLTGNHIDKSYCSIFHFGKFHGCASVVPLRTFCNEEEGFLVKDCCIVEVEVAVLAERLPQQGINFYRDGEDIYPAADQENAYHNPFAWDMSPYWSIFRKEPGLDITDLLLKHKYITLDGCPLS